MLWMQSETEKVSRSMSPATTTLCLKSNFLFSLFTSSAFLRTRPPSLWQTFFQFAKLPKVSRSFGKIELNIEWHKHLFTPLPPLPLPSLLHAAQIARRAKKGLKASKFIYCWNGQGIRLNEPIKWHSNWKSRKAFPFVLPGTKFQSL